MLWGRRFRLRMACRLQISPEGESAKVVLDYDAAKDALAFQPMPVLTGSAVILR
jgi:hypothetical protein